MHALEELRQRLLARSAARLAHDINNDLTVIQAQTELAARLPEQRLSHRLDAIRKASEQMRRRSQMVLALAQSPARDGVATNIPQALKEIEQIADLIVGKQALVKVAGELTIRHSLDLAQVRLLVAGLLLACLTPTADEPPPSARLEVISRNGRPMLWFHLQGAQSPAWLPQLATALDLDPLTPESTATGFQLHVSLTECQPAQAQGSSDTLPVTTSPGTDPPRLLVVDDEADVRYVLVQALKRQYQVLDAGNVSEAMARAETLPSLQMLITDACLADGEDGMALAAALRERWPQLPVIIVSGLPQDPSQPLPAGCLWLEKPISLKTLRESVQRQLGASGEAGPDLNQG